MFANVTTVNADSSQESSLTWAITDVAGSNLTLKLSLHIPVLNNTPLDYSATIFVVDRIAYFANGTEWGYFPFWINGDTKLNSVVNVSGKDSFLVRGNVTSEYSLEEVPSGGWQECYAVTCDSPIKIFNFTLIPSEYMFDKDSGILLAMGNMDDPISLLFGDFVITGGLILSSTNIDLGPQSYLAIFVYLTEFFPIILLIVVFVVSFLVYRLLIKRAKARRKY